MCTVTFLPVKDRVFITSNRDEQVLRAPASFPEVQKMSTGKVLFPRDGAAGGTWIGLHNNGNAMVLLNGAYEKHHHNPPYRKSRGLIFLDVFDSKSPAQKFKETDLDNIEPFTLVIWSDGSLWEARWDGTAANVRQMVATIPHIWSSVTLYDKQVIDKRRGWFDEWLREHTDITPESIRQFHEFGGEGDERIDLRMNRDGILKTVSITGIELMHDRSVMYYKDMLTGVQAVNEWLFSSAGRKL